MIYISITILILYVFLITAFIIGIGNVPVYSPVLQTPETKFSIIIPFRNEAQNLPELLNSLSVLNYPRDKFEIFLVNDASTDTSVEIINKFCTNTKINLRILDNIRTSNSPKKDAIESAISQANYEWIITTDADCIVPKKWLNYFDLFIEKHQPKFIAAPVTYSIEKSFFKRFQLLDFLSLQGATIGGFGIGKPFLCNGANLCYSKRMFIEVNGYADNKKIASGDDIFLMEKVVKNHPDKVHYLKSRKAAVITKSQPTLRELFYQRKRWAAKSISYTSSFSKLVAITVLGMNTLLVVLIFLTIFNLFSWKFLLLIFIIKYIIDSFLLFKTAFFFNQQKVLSSSLLSGFVYPFFSMFVAIDSLYSGFVWKGRTFKK